MTSSPDQAPEEILVLVAPLENLRSDIESVELGDGLRITRLQSIDFTHLFDTYNHMPEHQELLGTVGGCTHCFQMDLRGTRDELRDDFSQRRTVADGLTALRLLKPGRIGIHFNWTRGLDGSPGWLRNPVLRPLFTVPPTYDLVRDETEQLVNIFTAVTGRSEKNSYELALRRFEATYERLDLEDRLIDYWIALEALFGGGQGEISYRISLRIAVLLTEVGQRRELFRRMKQSYEARSRVVHGSPAKQDLQELLSETEDVLRLSLRRALDPEWPDGYREMDAFVLER